jgi:hypothetical protein
MPPGIASSPPAAISLVPVIVPPIWAIGRR